VSLLFGGFGGLGLFCRNGANGGERGHIDGAGIVQCRPDDTLDSRALILVEWWRVVGWSGELGLFAVDWCVPRVWCKFGSVRFRVLELMQGAFDVAGHGQVDCSVQVVPLERYTEVELGLPVIGNLAFLLKCIEQVVSVLFADVFDGEAESDGPCDMAPETGCSSARVIAMRCQVGNELVVCEAAGLGEAVHALLDFD
jgi:hypothetical protein